MALPQEAWAKEKLQKAKILKKRFFSGLGGQKSKPFLVLVFPRSYVVLNVGDETKISQAVQRKSFLGFVWYPYAGRKVSFQAWYWPHGLKDPLSTGYQPYTLEEAIKNVREEVLKQRKAQKEPEAHLEKLMKTHDWTYMMSDDGNTHDRGFKEWLRIQQALTMVSPEVGEALMKKYSPWKKGKTATEYPLEVLKEDVYETEMDYKNYVESLVRDTKSFLKKNGITWRGLDGYILRYFQGGPGHESALREIIKYLSKYYPEGVSVVQESFNQSKRVRAELYSDMMEARKKYLYHLKRGR